VSSTSTTPAEPVVVAAGAQVRPTNKAFWARLIHGIGICVLPVLVALYVGATTFPGGSLMPLRPVMVDLDVYRQAGLVLLSGGNFYDLPGPLQFLYPPFAAVLAVPLAVLPSTVVQLGWTAGGAVASRSCTDSDSKAGC
jgi:hypothetical protein